MKVPFPTNNQTNSKTTQNQTQNTTTTTTTTTSLYEPKSVLELRSSPITDKKPSSKTSSNDPLHLEEEHALINQQLEDWDSLMRELGLNDESTPVPKPISDSEPNQNQYSSFDSIQFAPVDFSLLSDIPTYTTPLDNSHTVGFDYVDELIRLAECLDSTSIQLGQAILARLDQRLRSPAGKPLQRSAFYFKEALQSVLTGSSTRLTRPDPSEIIQTIKANKIFSAISPVPMFSTFTANQAVLDSMEGSTRCHVIDFDIGLGGHWASFMKEMAEQVHARGGHALRISAIVPDDYGVESRLIKENLTQFAIELNIRFEIEFVLVRNFEYLSFKSIKFVEGERVAVLLSPEIFRRAGAGFVSDLRRVNPAVIVHVDVEGGIGFGTSSYRQIVIDGLEFYSTVLESLESVNSAGGGENWVRLIETFVLFPKILEGVEAAGRGLAPAREVFAAAGLRPVSLGQFAEFQAECLLQRVEVRGFHVAKRQAEMMLCWHDRVLVATSAWRY